MRKLSLLVVFVLVLSLLVAVSTPVTAGKPNPPDEKTKNVPPGQSKEKKQDKQTPPGQAKPDKPKNANSVVVQDDVPEPVEVEDVSRTVVICHKPRTPAEQTLILPESAIAGHMHHGDEEGPCLTQSPIQSPTVPISLTVLPMTSTLPLSPTAKITICHKPGTPAEKLLLLPASAIPGHLRHGDVLDSCPIPSTLPTSTLPITSTVPMTPSLVPTSTQWISICHKPGTPAEKMLLLPESAVPGHLGHGDKLDSCPVAAEPPTSTVPTTSTVPVTTVTVPSNPLRILICHKQGTADEKTLALPAAEIPEHLAHFDTLGACQGAPSITWATELIVALTQWLMQLFA